jgi:nucleotide-binding universal stress UspA family protein
MRKKNCRKRVTLQSRGRDVVAAYLPGDAEAVIAQNMREHNIDLLILGAYSHSPLCALLLGSKTSDLLRSSTLPALLLR